MAGSGLAAAYLIVGVDQLKRETATRRLKGRLSSGFEAFNLDERTASANLTAADLLVSLNTLPGGGGFRLVLIHDAGKLSKPVSEAIIGYLADPNPDCVLCLVAESLSKGTRLYKAIAKVDRRAVISCDAIKPRELPGYVLRLARSLGISIDQAAARELVSRVGEDTTLLERTLRSLGEQCGATIALEDVERYVARTAEVKPWEFLDKVAAGDAARALELYHSMQNPSHLALLALLTRRVRDLICARSLMDRGQGGQVATELGRQEWQIRETVAAARRRSPARLSECLAACAQCERELKGGAEVETAFVTLLLELCRV